MALNSVCGCCKCAVSGCCARYHSAYQKGHWPQNHFSGCMYVAMVIRPELIQVAFDVFSSTHQHHPELFLSVCHFNFEDTYAYE